MNRASRSYRPNQVVCFLAAEYLMRYKRRCDMMSRFPTPEIVGDDGGSPVAPDTVPLRHRSKKTSAYTLIHCVHTLARNSTARVAYADDFPASAFGRALPSRRQ